MLRDAQIIGCADMPQYADMPLLPLVMADQALHDISYGLREQASTDDDIGILLSCV